jgi:glycosyltransferase involved in cell wall biosynthesis
VAFGANTELFQPLEQPKLFDTIFPATFASWKRHDLYTHATKDLRSIACGYMYADHEQECWQEPLSNGVMVLPHVSANVLRYLYAASKVCVITSASNGGSQRSVLEAMAMNLPVLVTDSDKFDFAGGYVYRAEPTIESLRGHITAILDGDGDCNTRDYVVNNWSHINYADSLEDALKNLVGHTNLAALAKV